MKLRTQLNYGGNCAEAFRFHFGGRRADLHAHGGDAFRASFQHVPGQIRHLVDDHQRKDRLNVWQKQVK